MTSGSSGDHPAARTRLWWPWATAAAGLATALWAVSALLMADHGFDVSDEGFYVLSYRWWDSTPRVFTGVQYLYGPLFELLGWSIPGLRVARLVSILLVHLAFGWAFMRWLRLRRPWAPATRGWEVAGTAVIVASAGVTYGWLPLSPGYNDVVLLTSLLLAALLLWSMVVVAAGRRLPVVAALASGPPVVALVLAKWAAAGVIGVFVLAVGVVALRSLRATGWWRYVAASAASVAGCLLLVNLFVTPVRPLVTELTAVNKLVAADTNSPTHLLGYYLSSTASMTAVGAVVTVVALLVALLGVVVLRSGHRTSGLVLVALGPVAGLLVLTPAGWGLPGGGSLALRRYVEALVGLALVVVVARVAARVPFARDRRTADVCVVLLLVLLPAVQALGTGNPLAYVAVNQFACWAALLVAVCTAMPGRVAHTVLAVSATACAVLVAATTGADGLMVHPYRTASYADSTTVVGGAGPLAPMHVDPRSAARFDQVREAARLRSPGDPVMAFDEIAGLPLLLDGRSVGEAWYSRIDPSRSAAGIRSVCTRPRPWGATQPVVIYDRSPGAADQAALRSCGFSLDRDYRLTTIDTGEPHLRVYTSGSQGRARP